MKTFSEFRFMAEADAGEFDAHHKFVKTLPKAEMSFHSKTKAGRKLTTTAYVPNDHIDKTIEHYKKNGYSHEVSDHKLWGKTHTFKKGNETATMNDNQDGTHHELNHSTEISKPKVAKPKVDPVAAKKKAEDRAYEKRRKTVVRPWD